MCRVKCLINNNNCLYYVVKINVKIISPYNKFIVISKLNRFLIAYIPPAANIYSIQLGGVWESYGTFGELFLSEKVRQTVKSIHYCRFLT